MDFFLNNISSLRLILLLMIQSFFICSLQSQITNPIADQAYTGFNNAFLHNENGLTFYKKSLNNVEKDYFWQQALDIQSVEDYAIRTNDIGANALVTNLLDAFLILNRSNDTTNPQSWEWNDFNDDLFWATLAFCRGYTVTQNSEFLDQAEYGFNLAYYHNNTGDWGWDEKLGGGIWWSREKAHKETLSNGPAVVAACQLYLLTGKQHYLDKAVEIYDWLHSTLFNENTGAVFSKISSSGVIDYSVNVFNNGSFGGAANILFQITGDYRYFQDARRAFDYVKNIRFKNGLIYASSRNGSENAEYIRWLGIFVQQNHLWDEYYPWLKLNAEASWQSRRRDFDITWNDWRVNTPLDNTSVIECNSGVVIQQYTPLLLSIVDWIQAEDYHFQKNIATDDIEENSENRKVKFLNIGDYTEYVVNVPETGLYTINFVLSSTVAGSFELSQNDMIKSTVEFTKTNGVNDWQDLNSTINLQKGVQSIKIQSNATGWSLDKFRISKNTECEIIPITSNFKVNGDEEEEGLIVIVNSGDDVVLSPNLLQGSWSWTGPDYFNSTTREVIIENIQRVQEGIYTVNFTNNCGALSFLEYRILVNPSCEGSEIISFANINDEGWQEVTEISLEIGDKVNIGPQPLEGTWEWIGPDNFHSYSREFLLSNVQQNQFGTYTAIYTNNCGSKSKMDFVVTNKNNLSVSGWNLSNKEPYIYPNPNKGVFNISVPSGIEYDVKIYSISGNLQFSKVIDSDGGFLLDISSNFNPGVYIVQVENEHTSFAKKMIVK